MHKTLQFIVPVMGKIEAAVKNSKFSEELEIFVRLREKIPESLLSLYDHIQVKVYLNELDMKEFEVKHVPE